MLSEKLNAVIKIILLNIKCLFLEIQMPFWEIEIYCMLSRYLQVKTALYLQSQILPLIMKFL